MITKKCLTCGGEYQSHKSNYRKYCSHKCQPAWNKGLLGYGKGHPNYNTKGNSGSIKKGDKPWNLGKKCPKTTGKLHFAWKGEKVSYRSLHSWLYRKIGKPQVCKFCKITIKEKRLNWANIDHKYQRNLDDYIPLCASCHKLYDLKNNLHKIKIPTTF